MGDKPLEQLTDEEATPGPDEVLEMLRCAQINFDNFVAAAPPVGSHPFYRIARMQLDAAVKALEASDDWQRQFEQQVQVTTARIKERDEARAERDRLRAAADRRALARAPLRTGALQGTQGKDKAMERIEKLRRATGMELDRLRAAADRLAETADAAIANDDAWKRFNYMSGKDAPESDSVHTERLRAALAAYREATKP